jgi:putative flippase GtrA
MLIPDWRKVLRYAWSVRLMFLAAVLSGLEMALPFLPAFLVLHPGVYALLSFVVTMSAVLSRFVAQKKISGDQNGE